MGMESRLATQLPFCHPRRVAEYGQSQRPIPAKQRKPSEPNGEIDASDKRIVKREPSFGLCGAGSGSETAQLPLYYSGVTGEAILRNLVGRCHAKERGMVKWKPGHGILHVIRLVRWSNTGKVEPLIQKEGPNWELNPDYIQTMRQLPREHPEGCVPGYGKMEARPWHLACDSTCEME
nr:hypothetical protein L203_06299 [Cryptococcus depauperatus CBS 7841]